MNAQQVRRAARAKVRAQKKAAMLAARDAGKSQRDRAAAARFNPWKHAHLVSDCGNVGCPRCGRGRR